MEQIIISILMPILLVGTTIVGILYFRLSKRLKSRNKSLKKELSYEEGINRKYAEILNGLAQEQDKKINLIPRPIILESSGAINQHCFYYKVKDGNGKYHFIYYPCIDWIDQITSNWLKKYGIGQMVKRGTVLMS